MPSVRTLAWVVVGLALVVGPASGGESADARWRQLANDESPDHEASVEAWEALSPQVRLAEVQRALRSSDEGVARLAAALADPLALDAEELRLAMRHCAADPRWVADPERALFGEASSDGTGFGTPDILAIARTAASTPGLELLDEADEFHRALDGSLVPHLVPLLETKNSQVFQRVLGWLALLANNTLDDATRPVLAQAFLYGRARRAASQGNEPPPPLASFAGSKEAHGVPPALEALVRAELTDAGATAEGQVWIEPWLLRWTFATTPTAKDTQFLRDVVREPIADLPLAAWAVRGLAFLDPAGTDTGWRLLADRNDALGAAAASELARRGQPERLRALELAKGEVADLAAVYAWETDAPAAVERWVAKAATARPSELVDLRPAARVRYELEHGVHIRDEDVSALGRALVAGDTTHGDTTQGKSVQRGAGWHFGAVAPEELTPAIAAALGKRLAALPDDRYADEDPDAEQLEALLAVLEVRAPAVLRELLAGWAARETGDVRSDALLSLARLGDTDHVEPMFAAWLEWDHEACLLGRVDDPRVMAFLKQQAVSGDVDVAAEATVALAVALGLPEELRWSLKPSARDGESFATEPYATTRARLLEGDAEGAFWAILEGDIALLGGHGGERALARLRQVQFERLLALDGDVEPAYWRATAELAVAGDAAAMATWQAFLRDGRVRMLDSLEASCARVLSSDPTTASDWILLLNANCCLGFHAWSTLQAVFPTCPVEKIGPTMVQNRVAFERWYARHRGSFVWSRLLDGWVPGAKSG